MMADNSQSSRPEWSWISRLRRKSDDESLDQDQIGEKQKKPTWTMGILNDKETIEVPGKASS
jgi:hypothetical protein